MAMTLKDKKTAKSYKQAVLGILELLRQTYERYPAQYSIVNATVSVITPLVPPIRRGRK